MIANAYAFALSSLVVRGRRLARSTTPRLILPLLLSLLQASSLVTLCTHGLLISAYEWFKYNAKTVRNILQRTSNRHRFEKDIKKSRTVVVKAPRRVI